MSAAGMLLAPSFQPLRIAVFRALQLGDMLCFVPALRRCGAPTARAHRPAGPARVGRLRATLPRLYRRAGGFSRHPGVSGAGAPAGGAGEVLPAGPTRAGHDIALQMHGSGQHSNAVVKGLGAEAWGGFVPRASKQPDRLMSNT